MVLGQRAALDPERCLQVCGGGIGFTGVCTAPVGGSGAGCNSAGGGTTGTSFFYCNAFFNASNKSSFSAGSAFFVGSWAFVRLTRCAPAATPRIVTINRLMNHFFRIVASLLV